MNNIIEVKDIYKGYGSKQILKGLSLSIPKGSVYGLLGKNGAGKTTLIKCILGLLKPQTGSVQVLGDDSWDLKEGTKETIGYVPQTDRMYPWLTIQQLVDYTGSFYSQWNKPLVMDLITEWELDPQDKVGLLSEGQAQKLSIILALGHEPQLLVFDEPVASLDPAARRQFLKTILKIIADRECTVFFSTHITSDIERVCDKVAVLKDGTIDFCGELDELKDVVKRLRVTGYAQTPDRSKWPKLIHYEEESQGLILSVRDYTIDMKTKMEQEWHAKVQVEDLNLEEIFLELTR